MPILNIAGYKFISLTHPDLEILQDELRAQCESLALFGTILLSVEGMNINLAGHVQDILSFQVFLKKHVHFSDMTFHETYSTQLPFKRLKVRLKKEIITLKRPEINVTEQRAPSLAPELFKQWLDENRDITVLDTRNDYEVRFGTFRGAVNLQLNDFSEFPTVIENIDKEKPIVMFCTGGIRCEKAALFMLDQGFAEVHQLDGGILGYFAKAGGTHYEGECFLFDERVSVNSNLEHTETLQCCVCQGPVSKEEQSLPAYIPGVSCPSCA